MLKDELMTRNIKERKTNMKPSLQEILKAERELELAASSPAPKTQWERILVPIDFSDNSREALKLAVTLAADPEDRITLLHVVEAEPALQRGDEVMMTLSKGAAELQFEAGRRLRRWAAQEAGPDIKVETVVRTGKVHREILQAAETRACDVIVVAAQSKNWLDRFISGSVTKHLQRKAPCAVICIRPGLEQLHPIVPLQGPPEKSARNHPPIARRPIRARSDSPT